MGGGGISPKPEPEPEPEPETDYVDLDLPSKILWAKHNIQDKDGNELYFAWGDTQGYTAEEVKTKKKFEWGDYCFGEYDTGDTKNYGMKEYNNSDGNTKLYEKHDAATANWGSDWRMPTYDEFEELIKYTTTAWTQVDGVNGLLFKSNKNKNTLFFPAVGFAGYTLVDGVNKYGYYWSSILDKADIQYAWKFNFDSAKPGMYKSSRFMGHSVRPVRESK